MAITERTLYIYKLHHLPTGKAYIGHSNYEPAIRLKKNWYKLKAIDADRNNWCAELLAIHPNVKSRTLFAWREEQRAIDTFIIKYGRQLLVNCSTEALTKRGHGNKQWQKAGNKKEGREKATCKNREQGFPGLKIANERNKQLGFPGLKEATKASAKANSKHTMLYHSDKGLQSADSQNAFCQKFGLKKSGVSAVINGKIKQYKGWMLPYVVEKV